MVKLPFGSFSTSISIFKAVVHTKLKWSSMKMTQLLTFHSWKSHSHLYSEQLRTLARGGERACQTITISQHHICFPAPLLIELLTYVLLCYFPFLLSAHIHLLYSLSLPIFTIILGSLSLYLSPKFCLVNYVWWHDSNNLVQPQSSHDQGTKSVISIMNIHKVSD